MGRYVKVTGRALAALACAAVAGQALGAEYRVAQHWPLGGDGGWDYLSVDPAAHRLYVTRATHVLIVDTETGKAVGDIPDTAGAHGVAVAADLGRGFVSAGKANAVKAFELATGKTLTTIATGLKPDSIIYDAKTHSVVSFNGHDASATLIDARSLAASRTVPLGGGPEAGRSDDLGHAWVNLEDRNELAALDLEAGKVTAHWPLPGCEGPTGLALDVAHRRAFVSCGNAVMVVVDTRSGRKVASLPIGQRTDGAEFDPAFGDAYSANGDGTLTVVHESDPDHFTVAQTLPTERGARTIALDPLTHHLYLPTARFAPQAAGAHEKPPVLPGTFEVLVITPASAPTAAVR